MKRIFVFIFLLLATNVAVAADGMAPYYVPPGQLNASVQVMNLGLANITGLFSNATGSFSFNDQSKNISNLRLAVDATSIVSNSRDNQNVLGNLLGISQYPEIRFTALDSVTFADGKASIKGTLTVHGISKPITMDATVNTPTKPPNSGSRWGEGEMLGLSLHGSFKRADFGMADDPNLPGQFGDSIALQLEMQAMKQ